MLSVACSRCRHLMDLGDHAPGRSVRCPACHAHFTVPSATTAEPAPSAVPPKPPGAGWAVRAPSWPLLAAALLPLGIPLVNRGAAWVALGGALAVACLVLSVCRRPALVL